MAWAVVFLVAAACAYWCDNRVGQQAASHGGDVAPAPVPASHSEGKQPGERACSTAREAADHARHEFHEAQSHLDAFLAGQLDAAREALNRPLPPPPPPKPQPTTTADNPEWTALEHQLGELRQRRTGLLVDRTPLHPAVQAVEAQIEPLERQLAATAQKIPVKPPSPAPIPDAQPQPPAGQRQTAAAPAPSLDRVELERLEKAVEQARHAQEEASVAERRAWDAFCRASPGGQAESPPQPALRASSRWSLSALAAALAAGLTCTTALVMISAGAMIEVPVTTPAGLRAVLPIPVVGVLPATDPPAASTARPAWRRLQRWTWITAGVLLLAGCLAAILWS